VRQKRKQVHPAGRLGKKLPAREDEKKEENKTNKHETPESGGLGETSTPQPKRLGEQHPTPWNIPRGKQKTPPGKGGEQTPLPGEQQTSKLVIRMGTLERYYYFITLRTPFKKDSQHY
jgi:hypothetical protein